jgi:NADH-quinone oxidoreductase subunit E
VADATGFTPALCKSVASFYDMFRLHPAGRHEICVCTNIACALVGAGDTLREFERALGIHSGETTADGEFTLRTVECYGGCGWGPVVSVDERYHEPFPPDRVRPLLDELRKGDA